MQSLFWKITVLTGVICSSCVIVYQAHKSLTQTPQSSDAEAFEPVAEENSSGTAPALAEVDHTQDSALQSQLAPLQTIDVLAAPEPTPAPPVLAADGESPNGPGSIPEWARLDGDATEPEQSDTSPQSLAMARSFPTAAGEAATVAESVPRRTVPAPDLWLNGAAPKQSEDRPAADLAETEPAAEAPAGGSTQPIEQVNHAVTPSDESVADEPAELFGGNEITAAPMQSEAVAAAEPVEPLTASDDPFASEPETASEPEATGLDSQRPSIPVDSNSGDPIGKGKPTVETASAVPEDPFSSRSASRSVPPVPDEASVPANEAATPGLVRLPSSHPGPILLPTPKEPPPAEDDSSEFIIRPRREPAVAPQTSSASDSNMSPLFAAEAPAAPATDRTSVPVTENVPPPRLATGADAAGEPATGLFVPLAPTQPATASEPKTPPAGKSNPDDPSDNSSQDPFSPGENGATKTPVAAQLDPPTEASSGDRPKSQPPALVDGSVEPQPAASSEPVDPFEKSAVESKPEPSDTTPSTSVPAPSAGSREWSIEPAPDSPQPPDLEQRAFPVPSQSAPDTEPAATSTHGSPAPGAFDFGLIDPAESNPKQNPNAVREMPQIIPGRARSHESTSEDRQSAPAGQSSAQPAKESPPVFTLEATDAAAAAPAARQPTVPERTRTPLASAPPASTQSEPSNPATAEAASALLGTGTLIPGVPVTPQNPELRIEKVAPPKAEIGEPIIYSIVVRNVGNSAAHDVVVEDRVPKGAELDGTSPRAYEIDGKLIWKLETMKPGEERTIHLRVIPREAGEIGSVATVSFSTSVAARIKVTAPQLSIIMHGPQEAIVGEEVTYRFHVRNVGQGDARNVWLRAILPPKLKHPGGDDIEYEIGLIPAGASRDVDLTLSAAELGEVTSQAMLTINAETKAQTKADLRIIDSRLKLSRTGPQRRFVGRPAGYVTTVTNQSSSALTNVKVTEVLPEGVELASTPLEGRWDRNQRTLTWTIPQLGAGESREFHTQLVAAEAGDHTGQLLATDDSGNRAQLATPFDVKGFADLDVDVQRPRRPVAVGEQVSLRLTITNAGTASAKNVETGFLLPPNVEFVSAKGPVQPRQTGQKITFAMAEMPVGEQKTFDVVVTAAQQGDARITVQLNSAELDEPLETEEPLRIIREGQ